MKQNDSDQDLMYLIAKGDTTAYRELVSKYLCFCIRIAERMLNNRQDAEDIAQDVCLKIWNVAPRWVGRAKFSTWLYRVMINACIDHKRKIVPFVPFDMTEIVDSSLTNDESMMAEQTVEVVKLALQKLPDRQRAALILSYYEEISNQEAADSMGIRIVAFQQLLFRARQNLKEILLPIFAEKKDA